VKALALLLVVSACSDRPLPLPEARADLAARRDLSNATCGAENGECSASNLCCAGLHCHILHDAQICFSSCVDSGTPCFVDADCCSGQCRIPPDGFELSCG
jgi:hypothetical protein